ncbi:Retinoic acid induced 16-like protein-domain-containing protein [Thelephora terrestris]|uniref:Retinoic acid induced 16-like protein-domain-containing protein n=1 Tax=Thelephora terrestris TaxID=56493 RepID=A0A9P6LC71_9AGAM|nr:Retinoic acid induced 16-like protein-domain-containing protein [Thelephora terrestris]
MDYFSKFLKPGNQSPTKVPHDYALEFSTSWISVKSTLSHPDERQLARGIKSTDVPKHLKNMVDLLVSEANQTEEGGTGVCLEYLLKNDVLGTLVKLSEPDRPFGIQAEVLRTVQNMVVLLDEQFLVHSAVHKAVLRLLRDCVGEDVQEHLDGRNRVMGAAGASTRGPPSEYEEDLVNLLCILCSRIRTYRELLIIFFHDKDKRWYRSEPLFTLEEDEEEIAEDTEEWEEQDMSGEPFPRQPSPAPSCDTVTSAPPKRPEYEFLLFNYLLQFVHREGQIGDFARAGVLFLMDVAMSPHKPINRLAGEDSAHPPPDSPSDEPESDPIMEAAVALAEYIVDGDFSEVLAAGLAAVYSTLPSKLRVKSPAYLQSGGNSMVLGSTPESRAKTETKEDSGLGDSSDPEFKLHLEHFLRLLEFLQDIIRRNETHGDGTVGDAVADSILDAVRRVFFENVLYPSILECSDNDGSAVAVMSYIEIILRTLENGQLGDLLVRFLLSEDDDDLARKHRRSEPVTTNLSQKASQPRRHRKKSTAMAILEIEAPGTRRPTDYITSAGRFTLKDLLTTNLRSTSHPTVTAALQLFKTLLQLHSYLCTEKLLLVIHDPKSTSYPSPHLSAPLSTLEPPAHGEDVEPPANPPLYATYADPDTTYSTSERETSLYLALISRVDPSHTQDAFSTGYDNYLCDAVLSLRERNTELRDVDPDIITKYKHRLVQNDPVLSLILHAVRMFFSNSPELNMALTGVLLTLARDPCRSLAGWLTFASPDGGSCRHAREFSKEYEADGDDRSIDYRINEDLAYETLSLPATSMDEKSRPLIYAIFHGLVTQLERYRHSVEKFDRYLLERRQGLLFSENLTDALNLALDFDNTTPIPVSRSPTTAPTPIEPPKPKPKSSFVSFLTPRKSKPKQAALPTAPSSPKKPGRKSIEASPFGPHYQKTSSIAVEPYAAPTPFSGPWMPAKPKKWVDEDDDVFSSSWGEGRDNSQHHERDDNETKVQLITLSTLLDNVVILEEAIKELLAIVHARRALGIDSIRYI